MKPTAAHLTVRLQRFQAALRDRQIAAAIVSNPKTFYYLTGHKPLLSVSPTRPWYLVVPMTQQPVACVPSIGFADVRFANPTLEVRAWPSPSDADEGLPILGAVLASHTKPGDKIGLELGREMRAVMPFADLDALRARHGSLHFVDAADAIWETRAIKDDSEIAAMRRAIAAAHHAFKYIGEELQPGMSERDAARRFQILALEGGADSIGYLACSSGSGGHPSLTRAASNRVVADGDVIGFDTGIIVDEIWCDFNRNYAIGTWRDQTLRAQQALEAAVHYAGQLIKPGLKASALRLAMEDIIKQNGFSVAQGGRWGHGVGLDFIEPPSVTSSDATVLKPGMIMTLEPLITLPTLMQEADCMLVHEEMFLVLDDGYEQLT
jgi:Xaa-Pro aminopeptidase